MQVFNLGNMSLFFFMVFQHPKWKKGKVKIKKLKKEYQILCIKNFNWTFY